MLSLAALAASALLAAASQVDGISLRVSGSVYTDARQPLAGATVELLPLLSNFELYSRMLRDSAIESVSSVRTDARGRYSISASGQGPWKVVAHAEGRFSMQFFPVVTMTATRELPPVNLPADAGAQLRLCGVSGRGLDRVWIQASTATPDAWGIIASNGWRPASRHGRTDGDGHLLLPRLEEETLDLTLLDGSRGLFETLHAVTNGSVGISDSAFAPWTLALRSARRDPIGNAVVCVGESSWPIGRTDEHGRINLPGNSRTSPIRVWLRDGRAVVGRASAASTLASIVVPDVSKIRGRVLSVRGRPIEGALVWPTHDPGSATLTDVRGRFEVVPLVGGRFQVQVEASGCIPQLARVADSDVKAGFMPDISLQPAKVLDGVVVDDMDRPLSGAVVEAREKPAPPKRRWYQADDADARAVTDDSGRFRLEPLLSGLSYELTTSRDGFNSSTLLLDPTALPQNDSFRLALSKGQLVRGRVVDREERPLRGVYVALLPSSDRVRQVPAASIVSITDKYGTFELTTPAGTPNMDMAVTKRGYRPLIIRGYSLVGSGQVVDLGKVVLDRGLDLVGLVTDPDGQPIEGVDVWANEDTPGASALPFKNTQPDAHATTISDGSFRLAGLIPDRNYRIAFQKAGYLVPSPSSVAIPSQAPARFVLEPGARIRGYVVDDQNTPIPAAAVIISPAERKTIEPWAARQVTRTVLTNDEGRFEIVGVIPGHYQASVSGSGFLETQYSMDLSNSGDFDELRIVLERGATLTGYVYTADGSPVAGARVTVAGAAAVSTGDGSYRIEGIPRGPQNATARHPEYGKSVRDLEIASPDESADFHFVEGRSIAGQVVQQHGAPIVDATVTLATAQGVMQYGSLTGTGGQFRFPHVPTGSYQLTAAKEGYVPSDPVALTIADRSLTEIGLILARGAVVSGIVHGLDPSDFPHLNVVADDSTGRARRAGTIDGTGQYRIAGLRAGRWIVKATLTNGTRQAHADVVVPEENMEVTRDLHFGEGFSLAGRVSFAGVPLDGAAVDLKATDSSTDRQTAADSAGRFRVSDLEVGAYRLTITHPRERLIHSQNVAVNTDTELDIAIVTVKVNGCVAATDGQPVVDALVGLREGGDGSLFTIITDHAGCFTFPRMTPGSYKLTVQRPGYITLAQPLDISAGTEPHELQLLLALR